jgi:hypothetical protein
MATQEKKGPKSTTSLMNSVSTADGCAIECWQAASNQGGYSHWDKGKQCQDGDGNGETRETPAIGICCKITGKPKDN